MIRDRIINDYFEWLYDSVCRNRYAKDISYRKLLMHLHRTEFIFTIRKDKNRAEDGIDLRYRFAYERDIPYDSVETYLEGPCSLLEMMVALSIRCEETIMNDPNVGNRTGQWFWGMITNLGLGAMTDARFDEQYVDDVITRFLNREYKPNGEGGLFKIRNCDCDLREVEIWHQLCWYLDSIV